MTGPDFLGLLPEEARAAVDPSKVSVRRAPVKGLADQVGGRRPFPRGVQRPTAHPTVTVTARATREHERRALRRMRADNRQITLSRAQLSCIHQWYRHPVQCGLRALPGAVRKRFQAWTREMGRTVYATRSRRILVVLLVCREFGCTDPATGRTTLAGIGTGHLASLLPSERTAHAHVGRHTVRCRVHRADRPRLPCGVGDPRSGNCGLLDELLLSGLLWDAYQPRSSTCPRWAVGPSLFGLLVVVVAGDQERQETPE